MSSSKNIKIRPNPRISANELAKYLISSPTAQLGIIKRSKEVSTAINVRYKDVRKVLKSALIDSVNEKSIINTAINSFYQKSNDSALTSFVKEDSSKSVDVLQSFSLMRNKMAGTDFYGIQSQQPLLLISGVEVSVNCDLLIKKPSAKGDQIGALIFRMTKPDEDESTTAKAKRKNMGQYVATLVRLQVDNSLAGSDAPTNNLCWSVDVQCGDVHICPRTFAKRQKDITSACQFISNMWNTI